MKIKKFFLFILNKIKSFRHSKHNNFRKIKSYAIKFLKKFLTISKALLKF